MKTRNSTKILAAIFAVALLVGACFALSVSADDTPTVSIVGKNVDFQDKYTIAFAVEASDDNVEVELLYYLEDPALNSKATAYQAVKGATANYANVFYTHGVSAQNITDEIWAKAHIVDTDVYSDVVKYSVAEYVYSRLYKHDIINATEESGLVEKAFLESFVEFASNAQAHLEKEEAGTLAKNCYCAYAQDGTIDGIDSFKFSKETFTVTLNFTGTVPTGNVFDTWIATTDGATTKVANGATVTITGSTVFTPSFKIKNNNNTLIAGATFDNVTTLKGDGTDRVGIKFSYGIGNIETAGQINAGDEIKITQDPADENNKVLMFKDGSSSNCSTLFIQASSDYHGVARNGISVFETKIYIPASEILTTGVLAQPQFNQGGRSLAHTMNLVVDDDKTYVGFALSNTDGQETSDKITLDTWHALRLEFYNYSSTELGTPIIKVYIDNLYAGYIESTNVKDISGFMWKGLSDAKYTIYFDNMSFSEKAMPTN